MRIKVKIKHEQYHTKWGVFIQGQGIALIGILEAWKCEGGSIEV